MSLVIYLYSKCSTCQKALHFLKQHSIQADVKEIVLTPPTLIELKQMLEFQSGEIKKLFNTSGVLYRELQLSEKLAHMELNQALLLLHQNGMLIKRPFLIGKHIGLVGFKEKEWLLELSVWQ